MNEVRPTPIIVFPIITLADALESALPLEHTNVKVEITGPLAVVEVEQRFGNPLKEPAELDYLFPLPQEAAITGFELRIGDRTITGDLQEQKAAQAAYEEARGQGRQAGLFEQRRPNLFAVRLANVRPGETIRAVARYQQRMKFEDAAGYGGYEFVYPMGLVPKYDSPTHRHEGEGVHAPVAHAGEKIGPVEIAVSVDAGVSVGEPASPSHALEGTREDERRLQIRLKGDNIPDRDFVLRLPVVGQQPQAAGWVAGEAGKEMFLATLVPPVEEEEEAHPQPREFIFVLDRSGSMTGVPIAQARNALRACLRTLNPQDTFRILLFDNQLEWFQKEPGPENLALPMTQSVVDQADAYLGKVEGRGGTEIIAALEAVLALPADATRTRYVVFLTDGAVSAEARALEQIRGKIGAARLFTFGIGSSVNRALLSRMAELGRGRSSFLQLDEDIEGAIIRFQDSVSFPVITDLVLEWQDGKAWDVYPARLPDLYYGQPLEICGRLARSGGSTRLILRGKRAGKPVEIPLALPAPTENAAIGRVWARARIDDLLEQAAMEPAKESNLRNEIIGLALEYNLVTQYTSFVAIDQDTVVSGGQPRVIHVAQPLPHGVSPQGFNGMILANMGAMMPPSAVAPASFLKRVAAPSAQPPQPRASASPKTMADRSEEEDRKVATWMRNLMRRAGIDEPPTGDELTEAAPGAAVGSEQALRALARAQKLDGSWDEDVEWTAAALLAFVRQGHTTRSGDFRVVIRKAVRWLVDAKASGFSAYARALALHELAAATGDAKDQSTADAAKSSLPAPKSPLEEAALGLPVPAPKEIRTLDDLRLAAMVKAKLPVPKELVKGVGEAWAAAV
jgi:Ca-activated chloride channel homolog